MATTFRIVVQVDPSQAARGTREVERGLNRVNSAADRTRGLLARAFTVAGAALVVRQLASVADAYTGITNRLRTVIEDQGVLNGTLDRLSGIATRTRTALDSVVTLYQRGSIAAAELGVSNGELLTFVERVGQALAIQGGSAAAASGALIQLSQSLGSGIVRAEEFNSILEGAFPIAQAAARGLDAAGGSVAQLRQLIIKGKVTSEAFFRGFLKGSEGFGAIFARAVPAIGQALQVLSDRFTLFFGKLDQTAGVSAAVARAILTVADNLDTVTRAAGAAALFLGQILAVKAIGLLVGGIRTLTALLVANPFTAMLLAASALVSVLATFSDRIAISKGSIVTLQDLGLAAFEELGTAVETFLDFFQDNFGFVADLARSAFGDVSLSVEGVLRVGARTVDFFVGLWVGAFRAIVVVFGDLPNSLEILFVRAFNVATRSLTFFVNKFIAGLNIIRDTVGKAPLDLIEAFQLNASEPARQVGERIDMAIAEGISGQNAAEAALDRIISRADRIARDRLERERREREAAGNIPDGAAKPRAKGPDPAFKALLDDLKREGELLKLSSRERQIGQGLVAAEEKLKRKLTVTERGLVETQLRQNQLLEDQARLLDEITGPLEQYNADVRALQALLGRGAISAEQFNQKFRDLRISFLEEQTDTFSGFERGFLKAQEQMEDFATTSEKLITDAFRDAQESVVSFFKTGKFEADDFFRSLADNFLRLGTQQAFAAAFGQGSSGGGFLSNLLGGGGGGGGIGGLFGGGGGAGGIGGLITSLIGFQNGAEDVPVNALSVGRLGGVDNRLVAFRANSNETVSVNKNGDGGRPVNVNFNFPPGTDVNSFKRSEGQVAARTSAALTRAARRNN